MVKYPFEQFNIFFCTIVVALYGQPDFFMKITLTELEFAEKKIDNIVFNNIGVFGYIVVFSSIQIILPVPHYSFRHIKRLQRIVCCSVP